ncbi:Hpt domain-containing protein [Arsenicitalea aurantiaca]|uniref:Hpt domain-containing protein n=1 Tax=Arsenicitalea aurantiaca TaxID=1783274 RepID=A0A433XGD9_9HYPH|nr:Hpt domain-containing protein [Arsenicitalea aurantiaca]RUT33153.1 Hpt domain-containing protein [Arsenicitalea aurantiaca]
MARGNVVVDLGQGLSESAHTRPIDLDHLDRQTLGDGGLQAEVLRMFDDLVARTFLRLEQSAELAEVLSHLKVLRAGAEGVGAFPLARLAAQTEEELTTGVNINPERVDDLQMAVEELRAFIAVLLGKIEAELGE